MIKIDFVEPTTDSWATWLKKCQTATDANIALVANNQKPTFTDLYKKQKAYFKSANGPFKGRCAYCEQVIASNHIAK
jgi:hypothetical protein